MCPEKLSRKAGECKHSLLAIAASFWAYCMYLLKSMEWSLSLSEVPWHKFEDDVLSQLGLNLSRCASTAEEITLMNHDVRFCAPTLRD
jgi:hypothetical protein